MTTERITARRRFKLSEGILSILPVLVLLVFMRFYPMLAAIYRSFTKNLIGFPGCRNARLRISYAPRDFI